MRNPVIGKVTSEWSKDRVNPATGKRTSHAGIDIAANEGTPVRAAFSGKVLETRTNSYPGDKRLWKGLKSGNFIAILNSDGAVQWYGHVSDVFVEAGEWVSEGEVIGEVGKTGLVTGPHLHFETWSKNEIDSNFNPRILFDRYKIVPGVDNPPKVYYIVKSGDTVSSIAIKYKVTVESIIKLNGLKSPNYIKVGQKLRIK